MSSTFLPRLAAMADGECMPARPLTVARTRLIGLREPTALASTSFTPTASSTARMAPPAITPVPSDAGCMKTRAAPWPAFTVWYSVPPFRCTAVMLRRACSIDFWMATGTSRALPYPKPTLPAPSPTTVSAVKVNWRPPLTVLLTRLTAISFSIMPSSISSRLRSRSRPRGARSSAISMLPVSLRDVRLGAAYGCGEDRWTAVPDRSRSASDAARIGRWHGVGTAPHPGGSELQAAFARGVGQGLDAPMIPVTGAIESNRFDAGGLRLLGDRAADAGGGLGVLAALQAFADVGLGGAGRGQHLRAVGGEHLGVEVLAGAQHRQA